MPVRSFGSFVFFVVRFVLFCFVYSFCLFVLFVLFDHVVSFSFWSCCSSVFAIFIVFLWQSLLACLLALSWNGSHGSRRTLQRALTPTKHTKVPAPEDIFWDDFQVRCSAAVLRMHAT